MIDWFWVVAIGLVALIVGLWVGRWWMRRTVEAEFAYLSDSLSKAEEGLSVSHARVSGLEKELAAASSQRDQAQSGLDAASSELGSLAASVPALKQNAADAASARKAAEASLAAATEEQTRASEQSASAKASAADAAARYESITAEFVTVKRERREAQEARAKAEAERDLKAAEAAAALSQAQASVEEAERAKAAAIVAALGERDAALADAEEARKRKVDAGALRNEIMSSQRELADLREELYEKNQRIKALEAAAPMPSEAAPAPVEAPASDDDAIVEAPVVDTPVVEVPVTEADFGFAAETMPESPTTSVEVAPDAVKAGLVDESDQVSAVGESDQASSTDDEILTVDDLPGGGWEPGNEITVEVASKGEPKVTEPVALAETPVDSELVGATDAQVEALEPVKADAVADSPESSVSPSQADDLRLIKGIGPKFEGLLHARHISTFAQIAAITDDEELETYLDTFGGRIEREQWREQATALQREHHP